MEHRPRQEEVAYRSWTATVQMKKPWPKEGCSAVSGWLLLLLLKVVVDQMILTREKTMFLGCGATTTCLSISEPKEKPELEASPKFSHHAFLHGSQYSHHLIVSLFSTWSGRFLRTTQGVKQDPMDNHADSALHYGHVGRAVYSPETKTWIFARSFVRPPTITYTGQTSETVPSPCRHSRQSSSPGSFRLPDERLILNAHPDLAANWSFIREDAYSRAITNAVNTFDPLVSTLLDVGYALDYTSQDAKAIPGPLAIAAVVTGESRNAISFRMMVNESVELRHEHSTIHVPTIGGAETTEWSRWNHPILQICFAHPVEGKSTWIAARLPDVTTVFRPIYHRSPVPMRIHDEDIAAVTGPLRNSRLDANPVVEVKKSSTGGFAHADVSFNPWYPRQFAIVDIRGKWSVWEVTGQQRRRNATWAASIVTTGSLPYPSGNLDNRPPQHDGWASIEWITDFSTLLVCDRRSAMLFQMAGEDIYSKVVELDMEKRSEWVLDAKRGIKNTSQFFILTTSRLLWFDTSIAPITGASVGPALRCRVAWRHFRDPEDLTLALRDLRAGDGRWFNHPSKSLDH